MNKNYFNENEANDLQLLYEFSDDYKLFDSITPTKEKAQYDAVAIRGKRKFAVELKKRYITLTKYKTIMIEDYKYLELMLEAKYNNLEPLYINFLYDAVVVFNLNKLKHKPRFTEHTIKSEGYETLQAKERRYHLPIEEGVIYKTKG